MSDLNRTVALWDSVMVPAAIRESRVLPLLMTYADKFE